MDATTNFPDNLNFGNYLNDSTIYEDSFEGDNGTTSLNSVAIGLQSANLWNSFDTLHYLIVPSLYLVICVIGLVGNGVVILALSSIMIRNRMKSVTDILVINLAAADFIFVGVLPFWATELFMEKRWIFGTFGCKAFSFITLLNLYGSVFFLVAMGIDRYLAVVYAVRARNYRTPRNAIIAVITIWILAILVAMQALLWRKVEMKEFGTSCIWDIPKSFLKAYYGIRMSLGFFLPFVIIVFCYILIMVKLHHRVTSRVTGSNVTERQKKITRAILAVISLFVACWLPNHCVTMLLAVAPISFRRKIKFGMMTANLMSACLAYANSAINPILYAFMKEEIRREGTDMILRVFCCTREDHRRTIRGRENTTRIFGVKFSFWRTNNNTTTVTAMAKGKKPRIDIEAPSSDGKNGECVPGSRLGRKNSQSSYSEFPTTPAMTNLNGHFQDFQPETSYGDEDPSKVQLLVTLKGEYPV